MQIESWFKSLMKALAFRFTLSEKQYEQIWDYNHKIRWWISFIPIRESTRQNYLQSRQMFQWICRQKPIQKTWWNRHLGISHFVYNGVCYRLLSFWDTEKSALVIAANGFQKKTQKTPKQEIQKAIEIRKEYFNSKH